MHQVVSEKFCILGSGVLAAFLFFGSWLTGISLAAPAVSSDREGVVESITRQADELKLHDDLTWLALIHCPEGQGKIDDPDFLLSSKNFSPKNELTETIRFLYAGNPANVCRFPARYYFLKQRLRAAELPLESCPDVVEFHEKAPVDQVNLLFASENLSHPASMLGHALIKLSGRNRKGQELSHVVSFYTDTDTVNFPRLLFESMVTGKKGLFSLTPYPEKARFYLDEEQRTLWEYQLDFTPSQIELLTLHLLELRNANITYYFQSNNCATIVDSLLALSGKPHQYEGLFSTPIGVAKHARRMGLIKNTVVLAPSRWLVRELASKLPESSCLEICNDLQSGKTDFLKKYSVGDTGYLALEFASAYAEYGYNDKKVSKETFEKVTEKINAQLATGHSGKGMVYDALRDPVGTPNTSQITLGASRESAKNYLNLSFLPASHTIYDDNSISGHESSLEFFKTSIKVPLENRWPTLDSLRLYSVQSLLPRDPLTGGWSGKANVAYEPLRDKNLQIRHAAVVDGALGVTARYLNDIDLYLLAGGGVGCGTKGGFGFLQLDTGAIVRELWGMKSVFAYQNYLGQLDSRSDYHLFKLHQSKFIGQSYSVHFTYDTYLNEHRKVDSFFFGVTRLF